MTTRYIITAIDLSLSSKPRKMWIYDSKIECFNNMDFISQNKDFSLPEYMTVEDIILNGKNLK